jgi:hypothetical protein
VASREAPHYDPDDFCLQQEGRGYRQLQVPVAVALGHLEKLTARELEEHAADINAEITRRTEQEVANADH